MKNASLFIVKNIALLYHPLCNLSILLSVNLINFANFFYFSLFSAELSKVIYSTAYNLVPTLKNQSNACGSTKLKTRKARKIWKVGNSSSMIRLIQRTNLLLTALPTLIVSYKENSYYSYY